MKRIISTTAGLILCGLLLPKDGNSQLQSRSSVESEPIVQFEFEGTTNNVSGSTAFIKGSGGSSTFVEGFDGQALRLKSDGASGVLSLHDQNLQFDTGKNFSVQFWINTTMNSKK